MSNELNIAPIEARAMRLLHRWAAVYDGDSAEFTTLRDPFSLLREVKRLRATDRLTLIEQRLSVLEANDGQPFKEAE